MALPALDDLSPEEKAVILAMRQSDMAGNAIFNYATKFDADEIINRDASPWTRSQL